MIEILPTHSADFVREMGPETDDVLEEMHRLASERTPAWADQFPDIDEFPIVGPGVGGWLQLLAELTGARRAFEFGSGFGYSAYWLARGLQPAGELVLTELDEEELEMAEEFLTRGGFGEIARYEHGDALEVIDRYDGPFDIVLLDHENDRYAAAFETVREKVPAGGVVVADNIMQAPIVEFDLLFRAVRDGESPTAANDHTRGIYEYLRTVGTDPAFETTVLPVGGGISVSYRRNDR